MGGKAGGGAGGGGGAAMLRPIGLQCVRVYISFELPFAYLNVW